MIELGSLSLITRDSVHHAGRMATLVCLAVMVKMIFVRGM
jgi:hypothetical protein